MPARFWGYRNFVPQAHFKWIVYRAWYFV
jgi:hypothetical protein